MFDCIFSASLKPRALRSPEFKTFLVGKSSPALILPRCPILNPLDPFINIPTSPPPPPHPRPPPPELAFQRIETQYGVQLSRQIGTPNIAAKGKLAPRTVSVPTALLAPAPSLAPSRSPLSVDAPPIKPGKPLIEEVSAPALAEKGILKAKSASDSEKAKTVVPSLSWTKTDDGRLRIALGVPHLVCLSLYRVPCAVTDAILH